MIDWIRWLVRKIFGRHMELCIQHYSTKAIHATGRITKLLLVLLSSPAAILDFTKHTLPVVVMDVTSRCSLNCKECGHLMPSYRSKELSKDYDVAELLENIDLLISKVDKIYTFTLTGGEPFMYKELYAVVNKLAEEDKVKRVLVFTNATIIPQGENLEALKHKKVCVNISDYGALSRKKDELITLFKNNNIDHKLSMLRKVWRKTDGLTPRGYSPEQMRTVFNKCTIVACKYIVDGKLFLCPLSAHGLKLGLTPDNEHEYIDMRNCTIDEFWSKLNKLYSDPTDFATCYYCLGGDYSKAKEVPPAEQA